ncbi:MAG: SurA N-terminal domain-containing protein [Verrucomicrobiota bacterium]
MIKLLPALAVLACLTITARGRNEVNGIAAIVNGKVLTQSEVKEAVQGKENVIKISIPAGSRRNAELKKLRTQALDALIEKELILTEFEKLGASVPDQMVDDDINQIIRDRFSGEKEKFIAELKKMDISFARFRELRREQIAIQIMRSQAGKNILFATPQQVKEAYNENIDKFRGIGTVDISTITLAKNTGDPAITPEMRRKLADELKSKLDRDPSQFAELARLYSNDQKAEEGGRHGVVTEKNFRRDLYSMSLQLETGQISEVLEDQAFIYLIKANKRSLGSAKPLSDSAVYEQAETFALTELRSSAHDTWVAHLKREASIKIPGSSGQMVSRTDTEKPVLPSGGTARPTTATSGAVANSSLAPEEATSEEKKGVSKYLPNGKRIRGLFGRD